MTGNTALSAWKHNHSGYTPNLATRSPPRRRNENLPDIVALSA